MSIRVRMEAWHVNDGEQKGRRSSERKGGWRIAKSLWMQLIVQPKDDVCDVDGMPTTTTTNIGTRTK